jgi:CheY-like chemotaxis protein
VSYPPLPVLLVEDNPEMQKVTKTLLECAGYSVTLAGNGLEALQTLRKGFSAGLILLDLAMPVMDGFEFRQLQVADPILREIPVIICSAYLDGVPHDKLLEPQGYFRKDGDIDGLLRLVDTHCLRQEA